MGIHPTFCRRNSTTSVACFPLKCIGHRKPLLSWLFPYPDSFSNWSRSRIGDKDFSLSRRNTNYKSGRGFRPRWHRFVGSHHRWIQSLPRRLSRRGNQSCIKRPLELPAFDSVRTLQGSSAHSAEFGGATCYAFRKADAKALLLSSFAPRTLAILQSRWKFPRRDRLFNFGTQMVQQNLGGWSHPRRCCRWFWARWGWCSSLCPLEIGSDFSWWGPARRCLLGPYSDHSSLLFWLVLWWFWRNRPFSEISATGFDFSFWLSIAQYWMQCYLTTIFEQSCGFSRTGPWKRPAVRPLGATPWESPESSSYFGTWAHQFSAWTGPICWPVWCHSERQQPPRRPQTQAYYILPHRFGPNPEFHCSSPQSGFAPITYRSHRVGLPWTVTSQRLVEVVQWHGSFILSLKYYESINIRRLCIQIIKKWSDKH